MAAVHCSVSGQLTMPVFDSASKWLQCLAVFLAHLQCLSLALQEVSGLQCLPCCVSNLLTMSVLDSSACEWLQCLAVFLAC